MGKLLAANRNRAPIFITLISVAALITYYLFVYLPGNEQEIKNQRFRVLQRIDQNIHDKIDNSVALLDLLIESHKTANPKALKKYISDYSKANFILDNIRQEPDSVLKKYKASDRSADSTGSITGTDEDPVGRIKVDYQKQQFEIILKRIIGDGARQHLFRISMHYRFDQFIQPVLVNNVFDEYVLLSQNQVVYETFPTGIRNYTSDSLLRGTGNGISSSGIRDQQIGGTQYKMFLQPLMFDKKNDWILAGLLSATRYENEKKQLSAAIVLLLVTVSLAIIVAFPWLKLLHMGNQNRLTLLDGGFSLMVAMLLMSLLFFTFFRYNVPFRARDTPGCKENLAASITQAFTNEVRVARDRLYQYDTLMEKKRLFTDLANVANKKKVGVGKMNPSKTFSGKLDSTTKKRLDSISNSISFNQVFWLSNDGTELYNWTKDSINAPHADLSKRNYFINAKDHNFYFLDNDTSKPFYLDQVVSWTTGTFRTQISTVSCLKDRNLAVVDLSFNVKALDSVIMPVGYLFAIIDNAGNVLYHSDKTRNLNENLREEFSNSSRLMSSIAAHTTDVFVTDYYGKEYNTRVEPMTGLPYNIVILSDAVYKETKDTEIYSFTISMFLLLFLYFVIEAIAVVFFSAKRSFLTRRGFITDWIWPKKSFHPIYLRASIAHIAVIVLLLLFYPSSDFANLFFILPAAVTWISIFLNSLYIIKYKSEENKRFEYKVFKKYKEATTKTMIVLLVLLNIVAYFVLDTVLSPFFGFEAVAFIVLLAFYLTFMPGDNPLVQFLAQSFNYRQSTPGKPFDLKSRVTARETNPSIKNKLRYSDSFTLMAITKLIISSGIPVIFLYTLDYNYEQNLLTTYRQVDFASRFMDKFHGYDDSLWLRTDNALVRVEDTVHKDDGRLTSSNDTSTAVTEDTLNADRNVNGNVNTLLFTAGNKTFCNASFIKGVYNDGSWIQDMYLKNASFADKDGGEKITIKDSLTTLLLNVFRFYQNSIAAKENNLHLHPSLDSFIRFNAEPQHSSPHGGSTTTYVSTKIPGKYLVVTSHPLNYTFPRFFDKYGFSFWLLLLIALIVFYFVLRYIIKTMFAVNLPDLARWQQVDQQTFRENGLLFIIGPPGSGKMKEIGTRVKEKWWAFDMLTRTTGEEKAGQEESAEKKIEKKDVRNPIKIAYEKVGKDEKKELNFLIDEESLRDYHAIVINNFEYNFNDEEENCFKLRLLEKLMTLENKPHIIILSTIHPTGFLDSLHASKPNGDTDDFEKFIERWAILLGHFRVLIWPLPRNFDLQQIEENDIAINEANRELLAEFRYGHFLESFQNIFKKPRADKDQSSPAKSKFESVVENYYIHMSDSLTEEQKMALHEFTKNQLKSFSIKDDPDETLDMNLRRWETTVKNYYMRMSDSLTPEQKSSLNDFAMNDFVTSELANMSTNDDSGYDFDAQSYRFQLLVQNYYMHIWHSLTKEEKFLLYDLAEDGLVNSCDFYNLGMLISKGLIIRDQDRKLRLFNKSFCNFILTSIGNIEATKIQNQIKDSGHWNRLRVPLMIIIIAILAFLLITQAETYNKIIAYLGALVTGMLTFSRFFGFFEGKETKSS